ncbi:MAG: GNAT family N-acetyltransferase [Gammaproteobacteria bacterium]
MNAPTNNVRPDYPRSAQSIPSVADKAGAYRLVFAASENDLDQIARLRFDVFNLEMQEGLNESWRTCRDRDQYDAYCHHLMVVHAKTGEVVGTYRMQTYDMATQGAGFYSDTEFQLQTLGTPFLTAAVELGRACIAHAHRNSRVLYLLWRGLAAYMQHNQQRYFFGCCSLTSQDPSEGWHVMEYLRSKGLLHETLHVLPRPELACFDDQFEPAPCLERVRLPRLMRMYMDYGARIAGDPVIDRQFKTIDYLAVFDMQRISSRVRRMFVD